MNNIPQKIQEILMERNSRVPQLESIIAKCEPLYVPLDEALTILSELKAQSSDNEGLASACYVNSEKIESFKNDLKSIVEDALITKKRFSRKTINIGFAGTKGTGKSYMLQKLSGLTDNEVPSAHGMPVTAVRCVIKNSSENKAHVKFYDHSTFLEKRIHPFCKALDLPLPRSLSSFKEMNLNSEKGTDKDSIYIQKLIEYKNACDQFEQYLVGEERVIDLQDLYKFVSYTKPKDENGGRKNIYYYLAVDKVEINCTFPNTDVKDLQLIDLPGLGELDPSLEARHTEGFKDMVDLCLYIRRPSGDRIDWDQEAQKALDTLTENCPLERYSDFIMIVLNSGGCDEESAIVMEEDTRQKVGSRYYIIRTTGQDSETLSSDVLSRALDHLATKLPENDSAIYIKIAEKFRKTLENILDFVNVAKRILKQEGQGRDSYEIMSDAASLAKMTFAYHSDSVEKELDRKASGNEDPEELVQKLDEIQRDLTYYLENGMDFGSIEAWHQFNVMKCAEAGSVYSLKEKYINEMRVYIAQRFAQSLDTIYEQYIADIQKRAVDIFNMPTVLNGLIVDENPKASLNKLLSYIENSDYTMQHMHKAIKSLLDLKIEHNAQFYPRAYAPVRDLKMALRENATNLAGTSNEQLVESLHVFLVGVGKRTISEVSAKLIEEARNALFNILFVAYEMFNDYIIRDKHSNEEWNRFFKSYYEDIAGNDKKASKSYLLNKALKKLDVLRDHANR